MNKEDVKNVIRHVFHFYEANNKECNWTELNEACSEVFRALDQKPDIKVPDRATNGDMIKAMFPNIECGKDELGNVFIISSAQLGYIALRESWWNAPYKGGCNLSEKLTDSESAEV